MARIRTIKPEFPQSESMGRVSRNARLLFIMLWTLSDDSGRLRGNSRMLASLLFPYDDDAKDLIPAWLSELEAEGCIVCYAVGADSYVQVCNWLNHQKIDKPTPSKIPAFDDGSRILANPRESSPLDQGRDQGPEDRTKGSLSAVGAQTKNKGSRIPDDWTLDDLMTSEATAAGVPVGAVHLEAEKFRDYWSAKAGKDAVKLDWRATWRNWCRKSAERTYRYEVTNGSHQQGNRGPLSAVDRVRQSIAERDGRTGRTFDHGDA